MISGGNRYPRQLRLNLTTPAGAISTQITYMHDGRQYIALTIGGDGPELIALALPE